jgi:hypothetical protein
LARLIARDILSRQPTNKTIPPAHRASNTDLLRLEEK